MPHDNRDPLRTGPFRRVGTHGRQEARTHPAPAEGVPAAAASVHFGQLPRRRPSRLPPPSSPVRRATCAGASSIEPIQSAQRSWRSLRTRWDYRPAPSINLVATLATRSPHSPGKLAGHPPSPQPLSTSEVYRQPGAVGRRCLVPSQRLDGPGAHRLPRRAARLSSHGSAAWPCFRLGIDGSI